MATAGTACRQFTRKIISKVNKWLFKIKIGTFLGVPILIEGL